MDRLQRWTSRALVLALATMGLPALAAQGAHAAAHTVHVLPRGDQGWKPAKAPHSTKVPYHARPGRGEHLVKPDPHAGRVAELTGRRTADSSSYRMSDGSVQQEISAVPVHYRDAKGVWRDIDTKVEPLKHGAFTAGSVANSFRTYFSPDAAGLVRLEQGSDFVQVGADGADTSAPKVSGSTVTYPDAYPGVDLRYESGPSGLKEAVVLHRAPAAGASFAFTLKVSGLTPHRLRDGAIAFYRGEANAPAFTIPAPFMSDSRADAQSPYGTAYSDHVRQSMTWDAATGRLHLTVTPDATWLADPHRAYPVTIDPTIVVAPTASQAANVMISADGPASNYVSSWRLSVGTTTTGAARTLIRFPLPSVPSGTSLTSADLKLYYDQTFTTGTKSVALQALTANAAWDPATATWNNASSIGGPVAGTTTKAANTYGTWSDFPVTSAVQGWINGTTANNGFVVKASSESTLGQGGPRYEGSIYAYGGEVANCPKLEIRYGVPGVAPNPPSVIHATGAELTWPAYTNTTGDAGNDLAEYQVHRSVFQTFTPSASTRIAPIAAGMTAFTDSTAVPTPADSSDPYGNAYYYMVVVKTKSGALIAGPTQLVRLPKAGRTTLILPAASATTLSSAKPTTVLNTLDDGSGTQQPWLEVGDNSATYGTARAVFGFPALTAVPADATVLDAHLKLWQETTTTGTSGASYELHSLTRSFTAAQATWNSAATGTAWTTPGGDFTAAADGTVSGLTNDPNRRDLDATSIVQGWIASPGTDDGLLVKLAGETSGSPQERTIFAGPGTAEHALAPALVVTYLDHSAGATYYAPSTPSDMVVGTTYTTPVTINNTSAATWSAADEVLTYHWTLPDGTDATDPADQLQTALPADLPPAGTVTLNAQVTPPVPTDGNQAEGYSLAWDMYDKATGAYLSAGTGTTAAAATTGRTATATTATTGIGSLKQQVSVDPNGNNQLGLENFYHYAVTPAGAGARVYTNVASGNTVWNHDLFANPSRGFDTQLRLSYNSLSTMDTTTGFGWSVEASAPIRLGQALQFHPPSKPTSVVMVDGTGNAHQWNWDSAAGQWTSPPGVHLFLQGAACAPKDTNAQAWTMTRPDRTTIYYDCDGYPTAQVDANGNEADFTYSYRQSENKPEEFLQYVSDPTGRTTLDLSYYAKGDDYSYIDSTGALVSGTNLTDPAIIDHVRSITDVSGRTVDFFYTAQGLLGRVVDGAGTSLAKTFDFTYDATQGMKNVKLVAAQDPRGNSTKIAYYQPSSSTKWLTQSVTDRLGHITGLTYTEPGAISGAQVQTTVTDARGDSDVLQTDSAGRVIQAVDALQHKTTLAWDADNNVSSLTENNGAVTSWTYDPGTGYPLTRTDALQAASGHTPSSTVYTYQTSLSGHVADLTDQVSAGGRHWHYTYDPYGNLLTAQDPDGTAAGSGYTTTYTYDGFGDRLTATDADGHTTRYGDYDVTGGPGSVTDALGNTSTIGYGPRGEVRSTTDPLAHTSTKNYDVFLRPTSSSAPKDQAAGTYITTPAPVYDANDNVTSKTAPNGATTTAGYDADDENTTVTLPADTGTSPARTLTHTYDAVGNLATTTVPKGNLTGATAGSYTTTYGYDAADEPTSVTNALSGKTVTGYDDVGNKVQLTDPLGNITKQSYDLDHQQTGTTDAHGNTTQTGYDADGLRTTVVDQNGNAVFYSLDADGRVTQAQVPHSTDGSTITYDTTQYKYDQVGNNTEVVSPRGVASGIADAYSTQARYDADNRRIKTIGAYVPDGTPNPPNEAPETDYTFDAAGRLAKTTQTGPASNADQAPGTTYTYFDNGWTKSATDPLGIVADYDYNALGQQTSRDITSADGSGKRSMTWGYYPDGKLHTHTDSGVANGWQGMLVTPGTESTTAGGTGWQFTGGIGYQGGSVFEHAAGSGSDTYTWNLAVPQDGDYTVYVTFPAVSGASTAAPYTVTYNGGTASVTADQTAGAGTWVALGKWNFKAGSGSSVKLTQTGTGAVTADAVRIVRDDSADPASAPTSFTYTYDADGNRTDAADASPDAQFDDYTSTFDELDRLTQLQEKSAGTVKHTIGYTYDLDNNVLSQNDDGVTGDYTYDARNQLTKVVDKQNSSDPGFTTYFSYTPTGQRATESKANGNYLSFSYNLDNTLDASVESTAGLATVDSHALTYDENNNITKDVSSVQNADTGGVLDRTATRTYTPNNQVASVTNSDGNDNQKYVYDASGNVVQQTIGNGPTAVMNYNRDQLTSVQVLNNVGDLPIAGTYHYDGLGRLDTVEDGQGAVTAKYAYDGWDHLTSESKTSGSTTNTTAFTYDSLNRPVTETVNPASGQSQTSAFRYLATSNVLTREDITGFSPDSKVYAYAPTGERLALFDTPNPGVGATHTYYYSYNSHADVEALTDDSGATKATYGYTAYGSDDASQDSGLDKGSLLLNTTAYIPANPYRFNSARVDTGTDNYDMGFRTYDPNVGRFISRDAYDAASADTALSATPGNANRYGFAGGNPVSNIEQDGHGWGTVLAAVGIAAAVTCVALTAGECLVPIAEAALDGAVYGGAEGAVFSAGVAAVTEAGSAVAGSLAVGAVAGATTALGESAAGELGGSAGAETASAAAAADEAAAGGGASRGVSCGGQSFTADTRVQLADGKTEAISKLRPGDKVKSTDTRTGKSHSSTASAVMVNHDTDLYDLTIRTAEGDRVVHTTAGHRFFDRTEHAWVEAAKLRKGDELTTSDGSTATVVGGAAPAASSGDMWDITVPGDHDFYVVAGIAPVLVHNCNPAAIAARAKQIADDVHSKIEWGLARDVFRSTAVTAAEREDGSIVYIVTGSGSGLEAAQKDYIEEIASLDAEGRPDIVVGDNMSEAHAEVNGAHIAAAERLKPIAGAANRNSCSPDGCTEFLQEVGAQMTGPVVLGTKAKIPGQAMYIWDDYETWDYFRAAWGYL